MQELQEAFDLFLEKGDGGFADLQPGQFGIQDFAIDHADPVLSVRRFVETRAVAAEPLVDLHDLAADRRVEPGLTAKLFDAEQGLSRLDRGPH